MKLQLRLDVFAVFLLLFLSGCGGTEKSKIADSIRSYLKTSPVTEIATLRIANVVAVEPPLNGIVAAVKTPASGKPPESGALDAMEKLGWVKHSTEEGYLSIGGYEFGSGPTFFSSKPTKLIVYRAIGAGTDHLKSFDYKMDGAYTTVVLGKWKLDSVVDYSAEPDITGGRTATISLAFERTLDTSAISALRGYFVTFIAWDGPAWKLSTQKSMPEDGAKLKAECSIVKTDAGWDTRGCSVE